MKHFSQALWTTLCIWGVFFFFSPARAAIVINEIAAFESSGCEWVELYNTGPDAVDMEGWKFWENGVNHGLTVGASSTVQDWVIETGEYAIIAQDDADLFLSACGDYVVPAGTVFDSSWGSVNESGELIGLKDAEGNIVEQFTYIAAPNFSLERKDASLADYTSANWVEHASGHSFGRQNDIDPPPEQAPPPPPAPVPPPPPPVAPPPPPAPPPVVPPPPIQPPPPVPPPPPQVAPLAQRIVINEFVSDPSTGEHEWVELYNTEDIPGDLAGLALHDGAQVIATLSGTIAAKGFFIVELSASKLNNGGDAIFLQSLTRGTVDRVSYGDWADTEDPNVSDNAPAPKKGNAVARLSNNFLETLSPTKGSANRITAPPDAITAPPPAEEVSVFVPTPPPSLVIVQTPPAPVKKQIEKKPKATAKKAASTRAWREGVVSVEPGVLGAQYFYIVFPSSTDDIGGIQVYLHNKDFPDLVRGTVVRVSGTLGTAYGEARLKLTSSADIEVLATEEEPMPVLLALSDIPVSLEGGVVEVEGEVTESKRGVFFLDDGEGEIQVTIRERTGVDAVPAAGERIRVRGILHRRGGDAWEILVRDAADLERLEAVEADTAEAPKESPKGMFAVAAGGVASFLLGLLARARGAFIVGNLKRFLRKTPGANPVDKEEIL